jgi:mannitol/fructose-specific phosphotransferase system IIA component (Ntr-type)
MNTSDLLIIRAVDLNMAPATKAEWIEQLVSLLTRAWLLRDEAAILTAVLERESTRSTAIGDGVAIPHAKVPEAPRVMMACGVAPDGVDFDAPDDQLAQVAFLVVSPDTGPSEHLQALAWVGRAMSGDGALDRVLKAASPRALVRVLKQGADDT